MFVRCKTRRKDGKEHRYWSVVENVRVRGGRVVQRQVLYLGEINDSQRAALCRTIEVLEGKSGSRQMALFPQGREAPALNCEVVRVQVQDVEVHAPRQWGACWLTLCLWERLELDRFWGPRLPASRQGTRWLDIVKVLVCYRLIDPGSEWRLHRQWYEHSALRDLLGCDRVLATPTARPGATASSPAGRRAHRRGPRRQSHRDRPALPSSHRRQRQSCRLRRGLNRKAMLLAHERGGGGVWWDEVTRK